MTKVIFLHHFCDWALTFFLFKCLTHCYFARLTWRYVITSTLKRHRYHRVKQSAVYRHLMTPSWAILLITSHVPNAWKPVHVTMIDCVCAINSVAASGDNTAYALLWERWLLSAPYLIPPWSVLHTVLGQVQFYSTWVKVQVTGKKATQVEVKVLPKKCTWSTSTK